MATQSIKQTPPPRFNDGEIGALTTKIANICASIEASWSSLNDCHDDPRMYGRHLDSILTLTQVAGFIADHTADNCGLYGDIFHWLDIPKGGES